MTPFVIVLSLRGSDLYRAARDGHAVLSLGGTRRLLTLENWRCASVSREWRFKFL